MNDTITEGGDKNAVAIEKTFARSLAVLLPLRRPASPLRPLWPPATLVDGTADALGRKRGPEGVYRLPEGRAEAAEESLKDRRKSNNQTTYGEGRSMPAQDVMLRTRRRA